MILMNDFKAEPEELIQMEFESVERVIRSGWYVLGKEVKNFELAWAKYCNTDFAIGVGNGMDAIEIGLRAKNIGPGDEVITTPMTAFATILAIIRTGATPVFADINPETALLDPLSVKRCLSPRTKAVLLVHLYGQVREMEQWIELCKDAKISLLEDCAQAHSALWNGKSPGTFGDWGAYSFYPTKNLSTLGDGGALVTNSKAVAERANIMRNYGQSKRYYHEEIGLNSRLDELHAAILSARLGWLKHFTRRRQQIASAYFENITNPRVRLLSKPLQANSHVYHLFVILCEKRDQLRQFLKEHDINSLLHYPIPAHQQEPCKNMNCDTRRLIHSEIHAAQCLSIPCHPQMNDSDVEKVINTINLYK